MDPLLTGITIGGFIKDLVDLGRSIKDSIEKATLRETLYGLAKLAEGYEDAHPASELYRALESLQSHLEMIRLNCEKQAARQLTSKIPAVNGIESWWNRQKMEAEIKQLKEERKDCCDQFELLSTARIEIYTAEINQMATRIENKTERIAERCCRIDKRSSEDHILALEQKFKRWLEPPDMKTNQDETERLHLKGTGMWFLSGTLFETWKEKPGYLWVKGGSGTGKSVLSSIVIRNLFSERQGRTTAVAYFYFDFKDEMKQSIKIMLRTIVLQLSAQSSYPYAVLEPLYESSNGQTLPTDEDLWGVLGELLLEFHHTYLVLDALDECNETDLLVQFITRLHNWTKKSLHLLLTSQPRKIFENSKAFEDASLVVLDRGVTDEDIKQFVDTALYKLPHLARCAEEISAKVVTKSNGMFRLAACLLLELRDSFNAKLDEILSSASFPDGLFGVYSRLLKRIHPSAVVYVSMVLRWLSFSRRPITLLELEDALAFDFSCPEPIYGRTKRGEKADRVCKILEGMVTMSAHRGNANVTIVGLAHASVADYLQSEKFAQEYTQYDLRPDVSHRFLAQTCLSYLLHFDRHPVHQETRLDYPLGEYAALNWYCHLRHCDDPGLLFDSAMYLLQDGSEQYATFINLKRSICFFADRVPQLPLTLCAEWGYTEGVRFLLQSDADPNIKDNGFTALQKAAGNGHADIVGLLLEKGAEVTEATLRDVMLRSVSERGPTEIIQILLKKGSDDVTAWAIDALQSASEHGCTDIVRILVQAFGNEWVSKMGCGNALRAASRHGHTETVRVLLDNGAKVNNSGGKYTPLQVASRGGHVETVHLLLENGAEVNAPDGEYGSALQAAARWGHTDTVRLLLEHCAEVNAAGRVYGSACALQAAATGGHLELVRLLFEHGADVNAAGSEYGSPLLAASREDHAEIVRFLLDNGANANVVGEEGSALYRVSCKGRIEIVQMLLENGADVNTTGGEYGTPLQAASWYGHTETVRLLLGQGAEINAASKEHGTALQAASYNGRIDTVRVLLENGADINPTAGEYGTALQVGSCKGATKTRPLHGIYGKAPSADYTEIVHLFENGAEVNSAGGEYGDLLHAASRTGNLKSVCLLEDGANVNAVVGMHGTPLQAACEGGHPAIVRLLLENGANVYAAEGSFGSAMKATRFLAESYAYDRRDQS
ncbi:HET-domain-containing protein [Mycena venus]|uniref:HET-domain-containing protein n=1 Tax=Mycena venus TaxID=2733690 RepID=A0A8H6XN23_9AGAR|nr:HET-domain-containing protein [Mycena venus]